MNFAGRYFSKSFVLKCNDWCNKPFPYPGSWFVPIFVSLFVFLLLLVLGPCGIGDMKYGKLQFVSGYTLIVFLTLAFSFKGLPLIFRKTFDPDNWTNFKYLLNALNEYFSISFFTWLYTNNVGVKYIGHFDLLPYLLISFSIGVGPSMTILLVFDRISMKQKLAVSQRLTRQLIKTENKETTSIPIEVFGQKNELIFQVESSDFICALASGNYAEVWYRISGQTARSILRIPMANLEQQLGKSSRYILRCHRSTIINIHHVRQVTNNSRNYSLHIQEPEMILNVSRQSSRKVLAMLDQVSKIKEI